MLSGPQAVARLALPSVTMNTVDDPTSAGPISPGPISAEGPADAPAQRLEYVDDFEAHYRRVWPSMQRLAFVFTGDQAAADELAQDALVQCYRHWNRVQGMEHPDAWMRRVLLNLCTSRHRRRSAERRALDRVTQRPLIASPTGPDEAAVSDQEFRRAVASLPKRQAQIVALYCIEDMSLVEISAVLGIAEGTTRSAFHAARKTLAKKMGDEFIDDDGHGPTAGPSAPETTHPNSLGELP